MRFWRFCAFFIAEMIVLFGIYIGSMIRHFRVIEIGIISAVIALIAYVASDKPDYVFELEDDDNGS